MRAYKGLIIAALLPFALFSSQAQADEVKIAFGQSLPPYVIEKNDTGLEMEIIREALAYKNHVLKPLYVPLARVPWMFDNGKVDGVQRDGGENLKKRGGFYSDDFVNYHGVVITLKEKAIKINSPEDLSGLRIVAFQGAAKEMPKWFEAVSADTKHYSETPYQQEQVILLLSGVIDAVVADINIFNYYKDQMQDRMDTNKVLEVHDVIGPVQPYQMVFKSEALKNDFNEGLANLRKTGKYKEILASYKVTE